VPFWGPHDGRQHFGVQIPQKPSKMAFYKHVRASANGLETNDVIESDVIGLATLPLAVVAERRILFIASGKSLAVYFQVIKDYIRHGNSVLASVYSICRQCVVQGVA